MAYADRDPVKVIGGTAAVRATLVLGARELWVDVDGGGVPTGDLYLGDGSTAGGLGPIRPQALLDHGSLAGLADDDHTLYLRVDGARNVTGTLIFEQAITTLSNINAAGLISQANTAPLFAQANTTQEDADGGRESDRAAYGYTAAAALHELFRVRVDHDGSGADQKARVRAYLNRGSDNLAAQLLATVDSSALLAYLGEIRHTHARRISRYHSAGQTIAAASSWVTLVFGQELRTDTGFGYTAGVFDVDFDGSVELWADVTADITSGTRARIEVKWEVDPGGGGSYVDVPGTLRYGYARDTVEGDSASISGVELAVSSGDLLRCRCRAVGGDIVTIGSGNFAKIQRIQGTS